ncbi:MAG: metal-dependent hydrolase [Candidatus Kapabacteria bacterium]|nr:metal-dependent hydrolase [Ignavibacteriota bacterium]MCW5885511.1 metal-dependent hydrolase [Candidatus Kapabacteria bacterium]
MPDLITHTAAAYLVRNRKISRPDLIIYLFGAMLPDLVTRPFMIIYPPVRYFFHTFHTPVAMLLIIYLIAQFFEEKIKYRIMKFLGLGVLTHFVLDMFQASVTQRGYAWFFPFSYYDFNIGFFWPEDSVLFLPFTFSILAVDILWSYYTSKNKTR